MLSDGARRACDVARAAGTGWSPFASRSVTGVASVGPAASGGSGEKFLHSSGFGQLRRTGATGLEPATSGVTGRRSNQLSYAPSDTRVARDPRGLTGSMPKPGRIESRGA